MPKFILSSQKPNTYGFIVLTEGIDLSFFEKNPVMLFNHDSGCILGKWVNIKKEDGALVAETEFDQDDEQAVKLSKKADKGYLNGVSIGFDPVEVQYGYPGLGDDVIVVTKSLLREASLTPTPSNTDAIKLFDKDGKEMNPSDLVKLSKNQKPNIMSKVLLAAVAVMQLAKDTTEEQAIEKITEVVNANKQLSADKKTLEDKVAELETKLTAQHDDAITALVDGGIKEGKFTPAERENYVALAKADFATTKKVIEGLKPHTTLSSKLKNEEKEVADKFAGYDFKKLHQEAPNELKRIKTEEPERYKKLYDEAYKKA